MAEVPCGFVGHAKRALNLAGGHTFLGFTEQQGGKEPLPKRQVRIMEDRSRCDAELIVALVAVILKAIGDWSGLFLAARALRAFRPAQLLQNLSAFFIATKFLAQLGEVNILTQ